MAYNFKVSKGYDLSKLDQSVVKQVQGGSGWDHNDQARYDKVMADRAKAKSKAQTQTKTTTAPKPPTGPVTTTNSTVNQHIQKGTGGAFKDLATGKASMGNMVQEQKVNQDNDINTTITGDNNKVFNEQDNSIRQYGGDNRTFVYNAGKNGDGFSKYEQTPVSAATMSGFYAPDDSPAAQAKFNDLHSTLNRDKQKRYAGDAMKISQKYLTDARSYTDQSMENYLNKSIQYSYDRADRQTGYTFGDIWNKDYITSNWQMPEPPSKIESNAADIAKDAKKDIEDI